MKRQSPGLMAVSAKRGPPSATMLWSFKKLQPEELLVWVTEETRIGS